LQNTKLSGGAIAPSTAMTGYAVFSCDIALGSAID